MKFSFLKSCNVIKKRDRDRGNTLLKDRCVQEIGIKCKNKYMKIIVPVNDKLPNEHIIYPACSPAKNGNNVCNLLVFMYSCVLKHQ